MAKRRLNRQQLARIKQTHEQRRQRAAERTVRRIEQQDVTQLGPEQSGLVIANYGTALIIEQANGQFFRCMVRQNLGNIVCGDRVIWQAIAEREGIVIALEARRSLLSRPDYSGQLKPVAANLDQAAIIVAPRPEPSESLIDRYLVVLNAAAVEALLVINKVDLLDTPALRALERRFAIYKDIGYRLLYASTRSEHGLDALQDCMNQRTSVMLGQSGVGKSSLIKALLPDREIRIQTLSEATGHGMHTTTTSMLYHLPAGGHLIDSPGVRSFEPGEVSLEQLAAGFVEFEPFLGACKFSNCSHTVEPECALLLAYANGDIDRRRLQSFQQIRTALLEKARL
jgi:ribosome biogenesis GTPase